MKKNLYLVVLFFILVLVFGLASCSSTELEKKITNLEQELESKNQAIKELENELKTTKNQLQVANEEIYNAELEAEKEAQEQEEETIEEIEEPAEEEIAEELPEEETTEEEKSYQEVFSFSGTGAKKSEPFTITGDRFKIKYDCRGDLNQAFLYKIEDDLFLELIVNTLEPIEDESIFYGSGEYYIDANMIGSFTMEVYDYK